MSLDLREHVEHRGRCVLGAHPCLGDDLPIGGLSVGLLAPGVNEKATYLNLNKGRAS